MTINWVKPLDKSPKDNQSCYLLSETYAIIGPIMYKESWNGWLDLFGEGNIADSEGGALIPLDQKGLEFWADAKEFNITELNDMLESL